MKSLVFTLFCSIILCFTAKSQNVHLDAPQKLFATDDRIDGIRVTWAAVKGAKSYAIFRAETADRRLLRYVKSVPIPQMEDRSGLKSNVRYYYAVRAEAGDGGKSPLSNLDEGRLLAVAESNEKDELSDCTPLSIEAVDSVVSLKKGGFDIELSLSNTCGKATDSQKLRIFLSNDAVLDEKTDLELLNTELDPMTADGNLHLKYNLALPEKTQKGNFNLLILRGGKTQQMPVVVGN